MTLPTARELAAQHLAQGDGLGWFEALYAGVGDQLQAIPWADLHPNPHLLGLLASPPVPLPAGRRALVVGCGLGDDAAALAAAGWDVTAFDLSPTAVSWAARRFPAAGVRWAVFDATAELPAPWRGGFDVIFEAYTLQAIPPEPRAQALRAIAQGVAPGGQLWIVCRGRDVADELPPLPPWPLTCEDLQPAAEAGLTCLHREDGLDPHEEAPVRRFVEVWSRGGER